MECLFMYRRKKRKERRREWGGREETGGAGGEKREDGKETEEVPILKPTNEGKQKSQLM